MKKSMLMGLALIVVCASFGFAQVAPESRAGAANQMQVANAMDWIKDRMPNLYKLAAEGPRRQRWTQVVLNHAHLYQTANPGMKERLLDTFKREDVIYAMVVQLDRVPEDQRRPIRESIRAATRELLQRNFDERAERIAKLTKDLEAQAAQLEADRANIEIMADRQARNRFGLDSPGPTTGPATRPGADAQPPAGEVLTVPAP